MCFPADLLLTVIYRMNVNVDMRLMPLTQSIIYTADLLRCFCVSWLGCINGTIMFKGVRMSKLDLLLNCFVQLDIIQATIQACHRGSLQERWNRGEGVAFS
uniref:Uncharacterized protein n=1 Tax=Anguilla anguilla TaxID=7936 RepID=A0A0E9WRE1_ANGAN